MRPRIPLVIFALCMFFVPRLPILQADDTPAAEVVLPMTVESGTIVPGKQDTRVFEVPVTVSGVKSNFIWACGGQCIISQHLASDIHLEIRENPDLNAMTDGAGMPLFAGETTTELGIGDKTHTVIAWVMRDSKYNKGMTGIIGYDVAREYQWEVDPSKPSLTLRAPGAAPKTKPLATLAVKDDQTNFWVTVKIRNVEDEVCIMPQTPDLQISPALQKKWDLEGGGKKTDAKTYMGSVRVVTLRGADGVDFGNGIVESNVPAYLLSDNPNARSGLGQSLLNRFVYSVDMERKEMNILRRIGPPATQPAKDAPASAR